MSGSSNGKIEAVGKKRPGVSCLCFAVYRVGYVTDMQFLDTSESQ